MERIKPIREKNEAWVNAFVKGCFDLYPNEQPIALAIYRELAGGKPVSLDLLARRLDSTVDEIESIIADWSGVHYENGHIVGFWGLALSETSHCFEVDGKTLYTWCAWDSLFIPELLSKTAMVTSTCPTSGDLIHLQVTPTGIGEPDPTEIALSFVEPTTKGVDDDIRRNFCSYIHFFSSRESAALWTDKNEGTFVISLEDAYQCGKLKNQKQFGEVLP